MGGLIIARFLTHAHCVFVLFQLPEKYGAFTSQHGSDSHSTGSESSSRLLHSEIAGSVESHVTESVHVEKHAEVPVSVVEYPAPIPVFSKQLLQMLSYGNKQKVMLIYTDVVKEACAFYSGKCPTDTPAAKKSLTNIGTYAHGTG